jgi:hypothetical protein
MDKATLQTALAKGGLPHFDDEQQEVMAVVFYATSMLEKLLPEKCEHGEMREHGAFRPGVPGSSWTCPGKVWDEWLWEVYPTTGANQKVIKDFLSAIADTLTGEDD